MPEGQIPGEIFVEYPGVITRGINVSIPRKTSGGIPKRFPEEIPEEMSGRPLNESHWKFMKYPGGISNRILLCISDGIPVKMPK